ncbi:hypothetical protein JL720_12188 [Aureococcus anophagefferens]|nr:hypothetical protein JL720_12188 [Aureococcus anophagefferens]
MARRLVAAALLLLIPTRGDDGGRCHIEVVVDGAARRLETSVPPPERPSSSPAPATSPRTWASRRAPAATRSAASPSGSRTCSARAAPPTSTGAEPPRAAVPELGALRRAELAPPLLQTTEAAAGAHCVVGLARTFPASPRPSQTPSPLGAADFFFVRRAGVGAPDAAWRGAFDRFPQIAQFVVDDTGGQLQKLQLCFGHVLAAEAAAGRQYAWVAKHRPDLRWTAPLPAALARTRDVRRRWRRALARLGDAYAAALRYATLGVDGQGPGSAPGPGRRDGDKRRACRSSAQCGPRACRRPGGGPGAAYAAELCARSFAPDVLASPFYFRAAPLMEGVAGCSARHLLARAAVTWGGGVEWIEARAGRAV